jgi:hypothetical protein
MWYLEEAHVVEVNPERGGTKVVQRAPPPPFSLLRIATRVQWGMMTEVVINAYPPMEATNLITSGSGMMMEQIAGSRGDNVTIGSEAQTQFLQ